MNDPHRLARGGMKFLHRGLDAPQAREMLELAERPPADWQIFKAGSRSQVGIGRLPDGSAVALKYYVPKTFAKRLAYSFRGSRCHRSWTAGIAFHDLGIATPEPLAFAEWRRWGFWLQRSWLAVRAVDGISLRGFFQINPPGSGTAEAVKRQLQDNFAIMARHRCVHGDLKADNILVDDAARIAFIDLDAAEISVPEQAWRLKWEKDQRRFFKNWLDQPELAEWLRDVFCPL